MIGTTVSIGGIAVRFWTHDAFFSRLLCKRYAGFIGSGSEQGAELSLQSFRGSGRVPADLDVTYRAGTWHMQRGDFRAEWNVQSRRGSVWQARSPYTLDSVLRILHTLMLSERGGFLLHAASLIRNNRALIFAGPSGAGKTTMCRLAPPDATLLSDEISFVRPLENAYRAFGTPFFGELAVPGKNAFATLDAIYLLEHAPENRIEPLPPNLALRLLLRNVLLFAHDPYTVGRVFASACELISHLPVRRLRFAPTEQVWSLLEQPLCS